MPNWCSNELIITGPKRDRERFVKHAAGENRHGIECVLNEDAFIPYPKKYQDKDIAARDAEAKWDEEYKAAGIKEENEATNAEILVYGKKWKEWKAAHPYPDIKDGFNQGGYEWCCKNWGTKWGFCEPALHKKHCSLLYTFDSAWAPPVPLIAKMSEMFLTLTFTVIWEEEGGNNGKFICEKGVTTELND